MFGGPKHLERAQKAASVHASGAQVEDRTLSGALGLDSLWWWHEAHDNLDLDGLWA